MLTDSSYFVAELFLPNVTNNINLLNLIIAKREAEWMNKVLGIAFYKLFRDGLAVSVPDARWVALRDGGMYAYNGIDGLWLGFNNDTKQSPTANYCYYWYTRQNATQTTDGGETVAKMENSIPISNLTKQARAWNEMCDWQVNLVSYLLANQSTYPEFVFPASSLWQLNYNNWYYYWLEWGYWPLYLYRNCYNRLYERMPITGI